MGPSVERELWQTYMANQCQVLGLDVYNGSSSQLSGYQRTTRVSFPLLQKAAVGAPRYSREDLVVIDQNGRVALETRVSPSA